MSEGQEAVWVAIQKKTFTRWANTFLSERFLKIEDLYSDLEDGVLLLTLLELISGKELGKWPKKPRVRFQKLENLNRAINFIKSEGLTLVNTGAEDIEEGNPKIILGMIWTLILRYVIQGGYGEGSPKWELLQWVIKQVKPYDVPEPQNFTSSWVDGQVLCALTDSLKPGVLDMTGVNGTNALADTQRAMETAEREYQIARLLDPEDLVGTPDEHSVMTYVAQFRDWLLGEGRRRAEEEERERQRKLKTANPAMCIAYGPGLEGGFNNEDLPFTIEAHNYFDDKLPTGGDNFVISITGAPEPVEAKVIDNDDGTYSCSYRVSEPCTVTVAISLREEAIKDSPWTVGIEGPDAGQCTVSGPGVEGGFTGSDNPFTIYSKNASGEQVAHGGDAFDVNVTGPDGSRMDVNVVDNGDGTYGGSYRPTAPGRYNVEISLRGAPVSGSPFNPLMEQANAGNSWAEGTGLQGDKTGRSHPFVIHAVDKDGNNATAGGDPFDVSVSGPSGPVDVTVKDNGDGTYDCEYVPKDAGDYNVSITLHGQPIKDSPWTASVKQAPNAAQSYAEGPGLEGAFDNEPAYFTVHAFDDNGNPASGDNCQVHIDGPDVGDVKVTDNGDGTYSVEYNANAPGDYSINCTLDGDSIRDMPVNVKVIEGADASLSGVARFTLTVQARNKSGENKTYGGDRFEVGVRAPSDADIDVESNDNNDGSYTASYTLEGTGKFTVTVKLNGKHVAGSPFHHDVPAQ